EPGPVRLLDRRSGRRAGVRGVHYQCERDTEEEVSGEWWGLAKPTGCAPWAICTTHHSPKRRNSTHAILSPFAPVALGGGHGGYLRFAGRGGLVRPTSQRPE